MLKNLKVKLDMLQEQYTNLDAEKTANDWQYEAKSKLFNQALEWDDALKSVIANKTRFSSNPDLKENYIDSVKTLYENLTWTSIDDLNQKQKQKEISSLDYTNYNTVPSWTTTKTKWEFDDLMS